MFLTSSVSQVKELKKNPRKIVNRTKHLNRDKQKKYARNLKRPILMYMLYNALYFEIV